MTITVLNPFNLTWTLTNADNTPVDTASVTATLYQGRSRINPDLVPGTPVTNLTNVNLAYIAASQGQYQALISPIDSELGGDYILVIDGVIGTTPVYHNETPVVL